MKSKLVEFNTERAVETITPTTCLMIWVMNFITTKIKDQGNQRSKIRGKQRLKIKGTKDRGDEASREQRKIFESSDVLNSTSLEKNIKVWRVEGCLNSIVILFFCLMCYVLVFCSTIL